MFDKPLPAFQVLERVLGAQLTTLLRWLLFLPASQVVGVVVFALFLLVAKNSDDQDVAGIGGLVAGAVGGACSVFLGLAVAPRHTASVAILTAAAATALAGTLVCWARTSHQGELFIAGMVAAGTYSVGAVIVTVSFIKLSKEEQKR